MHLSLITGGVLRDGAGGQLGRVDDVVVRLGADYPVVSGVLATVAGRRVFVPAEVVREIGHGYVELSEVRLDLRPFERRREEVLLKQDVLDRQLINVEGARLVRTNEIELARVDGLVSRCRCGHRAARADATGAAAAAGSACAAGAVPGLGQRRAVHRTRPHRAAAGAAPQAGAAAPGPARRPGGGGIAPRGRGDHVARWPTRSWRPTCSRSSTPSTSASSSRSAPTRRWRACWRGWSPTTPSTCWASSDEDRRRRILELLPPLQARRVRALAGYDPATAGGLMSPDFICLYATATKREAVERIRRDQREAPTRSPRSSP